MRHGVSWEPRMPRGSGSLEREPTGIVERVTAALSQSRRYTVRFGRWPRGDGGRGETVGRLDTLLASQTVLLTAVQSNC